MFNQKEYQKKYRAEHYIDRTEKRYEYKYAKAFYKPIHIYKMLCNNASKRNLTVNFSYDEFYRWYRRQHQRCYYCKRTVSEVRKDKKEKRPQKRLSIDRKNNNEHYTLDNIVLACLRCNIIKGNYFTEDEMKNIGMFIKRKIWKRNSVKSMKNCFSENSNCCRP